MCAEDPEIPEQGFVVVKTDVENAFGTAVEVMQIHDDTYVVTTTDKVDSCLSELQEYYRGKQLRLRPQKTKILDGSMSEDRWRLCAC